MKVGIATYHYSYNEGAILQAYSTTQVLNQINGVTASIVDQRYPAKVKTYGNPDTQRKAVLLDAIDNWLPLSDQHFREENELSNVYKYINNTYDKLIIGSDVVWTLKYIRRFRSFIKGGIMPKQADPFFTPFPNLYWPHQDLHIPAYSYAAAIGNLEYDQIPKRDVEKIKTSLNRFEKISVRDERTRRFIESVDSSLAHDVEIVPDPTFGLDLDKSMESDLKQNLEKWGVDFSKPICCFIAPDHPALSKFATELHNQGYQTVSLSTKNTFGQIPLHDKPISPLDWSNIFGLFDYCVTVRMHGAIFCLKNNIPFVAIDINETDKDNVSKTVDLMSRFNLIDYCIPQSELTFERISSTFTELVNTRSEWLQNVNDILPGLKSRVIRYLSHIISAG